MAELTKKTKRKTGDKIVVSSVKSRKKKTPVKNLDLKNLKRQKKVVKPKKTLKKTLKPPMPKKGKDTGKIVKKKPTKKAIPAPVKKDKVPAKRRPNITKKTIDIPLPIYTPLKSPPIYKNPNYSSAPLRKKKTPSNIEKIKSLPDPLKYFVFFLVFSIIAIVLSVFVVSLIWAIQPDDVAGQNVENSTSEEINVSDLVADIIPKEKTTSTTSTSSTTSSIKQTTSTSLEQQIVCKDPYMRFGLGCCLDKDKNSICDNDEQVSSTVVTTTTLEFVRCSKDIDCGPTRVELKCVGKEIHRITVSSSCINPGSKASECRTGGVDEITGVCTAQELCTLKDGEASCKKSWAPNNLMDR